MRWGNSFFGLTALVLVLCLPGSGLQASYVYPIKIFTNNDGYFNRADIKLSVEVSGSADQVDFAFYNKSLIDSSIARIYFDDSSLLNIASITEGPGTSFSWSATPRNLPGGKLLEPDFVATVGLSVGSKPPRPHNGINATGGAEPLEWLRITFDLTEDGTLATVIDELNSGVLRIGVHLIGLPDGSSESVITVPEPTTMALLGLGALSLLRKRSSFLSIV